jgi:RNA polymerase sigma-70 factor, ECF subfamily
LPSIESVCTSPFESFAFQCSNRYCSGGISPLFASWKIFDVNISCSSTTTRSADFEQLALPLFASLYNHAFWLTRNQAEAEDLVQETFTKSLRAFDTFEPGTNFKAWIFRILRNTFLTTRTGIAASRTVFLEDHPDTFDTAGPTPEDTLIRLDNQAALHTALEQLQPQLREALLLYDVEEIKYKDIAVILDVPIGTVMSRISRARRTLRQILLPQLGESL